MPNLSHNQLIVKHLNVFSKHKTEKEKILEEKMGIFSVPNIPLGGDPFRRINNFKMQR